MDVGDHIVHLFFIPGDMNKGMYVMYPCPLSDVSELGHLLPSDSSTTFDPAFDYSIISCSNW